KGFLFHKSPFTSAGHRVGVTPRRGTIPVEILPLMFERVNSTTGLRGHTSKELAAVNLVGEFMRRDCGIRMLLVDTAERCHANETRSSQVSSSDKLPTTPIYICLV